MPDVYVIDAEAAIELLRRGHTKPSGDYELFAQRYSDPSAGHPPHRNRTGD